MTYDSEEVCVPVERNAGRLRDDEGKRDLEAAIEAVPTPAHFWRVKYDYQDGKWKVWRWTKSIRPAKPDWFEAVGSYSLCDVEFVSKKGAENYIRENVIGAMSGFYAYDTEGRPAP